MREGSVVGEMGLYTRASRTASAIAETRCRVGVLSAESFETMQKDDPDIAAQVHKAIVTLLSNRIARVDRTLDVEFS